MIERHISTEYQIDGMSVEQMYAMQLLESGENMFLTGPGGTGKSFLISKFIDWANENDRDIRVTALTGCAALLLGKTAKTLHSFGGFKANVGKIPNEDILKDIQKNVKNANGQENYEYLNPWQKREKSGQLVYFNYMTDILVVDEVSMVDTVMLDLLDKSCRMVQNPE